MSASELLQAPEQDGGPDNAEVTARANALALAYQGGQHDALPELVTLLRPLIRTVLSRYRRGAHVLPPSIDLEDLEQQSWLILDMLARRWDPAGGDFPAYVRVTFLWELWRYVRALSPGRRARTVRVDNVQHDTLLECVDDRAEVDGRRWDDRLIATEMLSVLDPIARWVFLLHILEDRPFHDVARALQITLPGSYRAYRRGLDQLRLRAGLELDPDDALAHEAGAQPAVERLVRVLHERVGPSGRLPGRAVVCELAGLSEVRFARLMGLLATRGCIVDRSARKTGRLAHRTVEETLAHLRRPAERPDGSDAPPSSDACGLDAASDPEGTADAGI
ncbi:MAG: sigma-70 family RNA polymerase sigma factor [Chloroflexota bacterium]